MSKSELVLKTAIALMVSTSLLVAAEPVDRELSPEGRAVLKYLESVYGKKTLSGVWGDFGNGPYVLESSQREPAVLARDLTGWNSPTWGKTYTPVVQSYINDAKQWWNKGGIVSIQFHWKNPLKPDGSAWNDRPKGAERFSVAEAIKPGTKENAALMEDLKKHADYLQQLAEAHVPVLWRPLHEIDGGWFWWTDEKQPENTAALWRLIYDYLVKERKLHNLIWVYSAGVHPGGLRQAVKAAHPDDPKYATTLADEISFRKRYYPRAEYVDIAGIDVYPDHVYGKPVDDAYPKAFALMEQVAPGKMLALCEGEAIPNPDLMAKSGPRWLYCLQWWEGAAAWNRQCYNHDFVVTLDQLPVIVPRPLPPSVRITSPTDGASVAGDAIPMRAEAGVREGSVAKVEFRRLQPSWQNWFLLGPEKKIEALQNSVLIGEVTSAPFLYNWQNAPAGFHNIIAKVTDAKGVTAVSNVARIAVGLKNLALNKPLAVSSSQKNSNPAAVVDGDLYTSWSSEKGDPQWISVDLGSVQTVGAVNLVWSKIYGKAFQIQVGTDTNQWTEVHAETDGRGGATLARFTPTPARYVRMLGTKRGADWGGYGLYEFGVYESVPEPPKAK